MIYRFIEVVPKKLYRGSAPSPQDVLNLKNNFGIKKIISLDEEAGKKINRSCHMLNIEHVMMPIEMHNIKSSLLKLFHHDLKKLLLDDSPTFVHCAAGKDRTGLVIAIFKCKYLNEDPNMAIDEAKKLGFGVGIDPRVTSLFEKLIRACTPEKSDYHSTNDIVSNEREYISDNRSSYLDEGHQGSFAPYLSQTKQYPMDSVYNYINDQYPTRENYDKSLEESNQRDVVPLVGLFNNDAGGRGFGPTENAGGFFYD